MALGKRCQPQQVVMQLRQIEVALPRGKPADSTPVRRRYRNTD